MDILDSYYQVTFPDGTIVDSNNMSWQFCSTKKTVQKYGRFKLVYANKIPIKSVLIHHQGIEKSLEVPEGYNIFQSITMETIFSNGNIKEIMTGRTVGLIKNDIITEEYFINGDLREVIGFKYNNG